MVVDTDTDLEQRGRVLAGVSCRFRLHRTPELTQIEFVDEGFDGADRIAGGYALVDACRNKKPWSSSMKRFIELRLSTQTVRDSEFESGVGAYRLTRGGRSTTAEKTGERTSHEQRWRTASNMPASRGHE